MDDFREPDEKSAANAASGRVARLPTFDAKRYRHHLSADIDDKDAEELLRTIWSIMCTFVELGWGVESVQSVLPFMRAGARESPVGGEASEGKDEHE